MCVQLCLTLCDPMDRRLLCPWDLTGKNTGVCCHYSTPGDLPHPGIESMSFASPALVDSLLLSHQGSLKLITCVCAQLLSQFQLFATPWTAACQASLSFAISWNLLKLMFIESVMPSNLICNALEIDYLPCDYFGCDGQLSARTLLLFKKICIYLSALGLSCSHPGSLVVAQGLGCPAACRILLIVLEPGIEPEFPALEGGFLTTGPLRKSLCYLFVFLRSRWHTAQATADS